MPSIRLVGAWLGLSVVVNFGGYFGYLVRAKEYGVSGGTGAVIEFRHLFEHLSPGVCLFERRPHGDGPVVT